ncbi:hypothetical protein CSTERLE_03160 [Thermoclostridium stercorarium subsp. leptospartum DSM 9219]|uniref:Phosphodiester glycosidase domain-containing protein n=1 Tax=Thermoclostridium stercorarium subsp. leptospartum DSM 9219 TaxID=1346611 RepID=A0A1B1YIP5_THEST|nr:phosphodiester glycosidase family protein [Thermoclostridium stercorarium]ANX00660.1 hypothetical protein CSTERLE_03160 [Thermoclostridium stercorarium subsp. leptospartum DSM 9219]
MAATFGSELYTVNGKKVRLMWLEAGIDELTIRNIGENSLRTAKDEKGNQLYGVNGVFFQMVEPDKGNLYGYAINNGAPIGPNERGSWNSGGNGFMVVYLKKELPDKTFLFVSNNAMQTDDNKNQFPVTHKGYTVQMSDVKWAVGGISLHLSENFSKAADYYSRLSNDKEWDVDNKADRPRTAIGYKGGKKIILCTIFDGDDITKDGAGYGCNLWDVRTIMKDKFGCTMGLNLDGGGSTQISYKENGKDYYQGFGRASYCMLCVPM